MLSLSSQHWKQFLATSMVAIACAGAIGALQVPQLRKISANNTTSPEALKRDVEAERLQLTVVQKLPSFGFDNLIADWAFLKFLQYFGDDDARDQTGYRLSPEYFEVILGRDPRFLDAYLFLSGSTSLYAGMPERAVALMEKGLQSLSPQVPPKSYYVWRYKGIDELLFLGDPQAARKSFEMTAKWASTYPDEESQSVARFSQRTADFLARNPNSKSAQIAAWSLVLSNATDDRTRQIAIERIRALGGDVTVNSSGGLQIKPPAQD